MPKHDLASCPIERKPLYKPSMLNWLSNSEDCRLANRHGQIRIVKSLKYIMRYVNVYVYIYVYKRGEGGEGVPIT
jgi:hypothetical protein